MSKKDKGKVVEEPADISRTRSSSVFTATAGTPPLHQAKLTI